MMINRDIFILITYSLIFWLASCKNGLKEIQSKEICDVKLKALEIFAGNYTDNIPDSISIDSVNVYYAIYNSDTNLVHKAIKNFWTKDYPYSDTNLYTKNTISWKTHLTKLPPNFFDMTTDVSEFPRKERRNDINLEVLSKYSTEKTHLVFARCFTVGSYYRTEFLFIFDKKGNHIRTLTAQYIE